MDADNTPARPATPTAGGTVEPANRAQVARERYQTPDEPAAERYELRDPFAEVTYRSSSFQEISAKAEQLNANRIVAITADGQRMPMQRVAGQWQRVEPPAAAQERDTRQASPAPSPEPRATSPTPQPPPSAARRAKSQDTADAAESNTTVNLDAKAERAALVARLEAALTERYLIKRAPVTVGDVTLGRTEYRFRGDTSRVAFTESTFRLATDTNSPSVARSMVDVAEARNWKALRVSGNEDFRRLVWLEASVRGVKALGYEPNPADLEMLKREREARLTNRIEPARDGTASTAAPAAKDSGRGSGGRKTVLAAIEAILMANRVPEAQRAAVMDAATEKLAQRIREGQAPQVKVYDKAAPSQRPVAVPTPELQRTRERAAPSPTR